MTPTVQTLHVCPEIHTCAECGKRLTKAEVKRKYRRPAHRLVPDHNVAIMSNPSKMPGFSFGLPALKACPRANGTICKQCYALKGRYIFENVVHAQEVRFAWTVESMRTDDGFQRWIAAMVRCISSTRAEYFRIHDSGDFFNARYASAWLEVCRRCPQKKFWAPTRAYQQPSGSLPMYDPLLAILRQLAALPNVTVRPSALNFGDAAPVVVGLHAGSSAGSDSAPHQCPARYQDNECGECRHCWEAKTLPVNYPIH